MGLWRPNTDQLTLSGHPTLAAKIDSAWKFEEAAGATRVDTPGSNDLTDNNTVGQVVGKFGYAADFNAANSQYASIADASQANLDPLTADWALSVWCKPDDITASRCIFGKGATANNATEAPGYRVILNITSGTIRTTMNMADNGSTTRLTQQSSSGQALTAGAWNLLVFFFDRDGNYTPYINNVASTALSIAAESGTIDVSAAFAWGASPVNGGGQSVYGDFSLEQGIKYNALLTQAELDFLWQGGTGVPY